MDTYASLLFCFLPLRFQRSFSISDNDDVPTFDEVTQIQFSRTEDYQITYEEDSSSTYREEDVYFTQQDGDDVPLDTSKVDSYLQTIHNLDLSNYTTYNATDEEIAACGLDDPQLTITVDYSTEDEDGNMLSDTFVLHVSRDPEELAEAEAAAQEDTESEESADTSEEEEITAYARVGDSPILYQITADEYNKLMAAAYDDLRHSEVLPADTEDISQIDITLDGETYTITSLTDGESRSYYYQEELTDLTDFQSALETLTADTFTQESPSQKEEISLKLQLDQEGEPSVQIDLYRYDGSYCLAVVDGEPVSLVARSSVIYLVEAVNAIVLNRLSPNEDAFIYRSSLMQNGGRELRSSLPPFCRISGVEYALPYRSIELLYIDISSHYICLFDIFNYFCYDNMSCRNQNILYK